MKKIMFNDKYGLTQAVLEGRKTQTRRIIKCPKTFKGEEVRGFYVYKRETDSEIAMCACMHDADGFEIEGGELLPRYKVGETVAVAQRYSDVWLRSPCLYRYLYSLKDSRWWNNKMFVSAGLMPYKIQITNVWMEHLQDISDEDCLAEGVMKIKSNKISKAFGLSNSYEIPGQFPIFDSPREAYSALIDKVAGKGTWESNPWVWVYDFKLIK